MRRRFQKLFFSLTCIKYPFFLAALLFHCGVIGYYFFPALVISKHPIELDDAYAYIHKASSLGSCGAGLNCKAYQSLQEQSRRSQADQWLRDRFDGRLFCNYSPFHSMLLKAFHFVSGNWNSAYSLLVLLGIGLISFSTAGLAWFWGGPLAAGLYLLAFSSLKFPGSGWQFIVPTNISLSFAVIAWIICILGRSKFWPVALFTALSLATHPIGLVYAFPTFGFIFLQRRKFNLLPSFVSLLAVIILTKGFIKFMEPDTGSCAFGAHLGWEKLNWTIAWDIFGRWVKTQGGGYASAIGLVLAGLFFLPRPKRGFACILTIFILAAYIVSPFYVLPGYAAELPQRLLLPLGLIFMGLQSHTLGFLISKNLKMAVRFNPKKLFQLSLLSVLVLALLIDRGRMMKMGLLGSFYEWNSLQYWRELISTNRTVYWSPSQTEILLQNSSENDEIVYTHEVGLYHHLAHGASSRGALFLPYLTADQRPKDLAKTHRLFALSSPISGLDLSISPLTIVPAGKQSSEGQLLLENRSIARSRIEVLNGKAGNISFELGGREKLWIKLPRIDSEKIGLTIAKTEEPVFVLGLKVSSEQKSFWPWNQGLTISHDSRPLNLSLQESYCQIDCKHDFDLLSDEGSGLILRSKK